MTEYLKYGSGSLPDGARLEPMLLKIGATCQHHRLHLPFFACGHLAAYVLIKAHGERVALCNQHALELRQRFDDSSPENPREDGSYGWPENDVDLNFRYPIEDVVEPKAPDYATTAFAGGESGGGGGGDAWTENKAAAEEGHDVSAGSEDTFRADTESPTMEADAGVGSGPEAETEEADTTEAASTDEQA